MTLKTNGTKPIYEGALVYATRNTEVEQKGGQEDFQLEVVEYQEHDQRRLQKHYQKNSTGTYEKSINPIKSNRVWFSSGNENRYIYQPNQNK